MGVKMTVPFVDNGRLGEREIPDGPLTRSDATALLETVIDSLIEAGQEIDTHEEVERLIRFRDDWFRRN